MKSKHAILPYVYICTHRITGEFYIGGRFGNRVPSYLDFGNSYFTSSKVVKEAFNDFEFKILSEFLSRDDAYDYEQFLISQFFRHPLCLNRSCFHEKRRFISTPESLQKSKEGLIRNHGVTNPGQTEKSRKTAAARMRTTKNPALNQSLETRGKISSTIRKQMKALTAEEKSIKFGNHGISNPFFGKQHDEETILRMIEIKAKFEYTITSPDGISIITKNLNSFCKQNQLNYDIFKKYMNRGKIPPPPNFGFAARIKSIGWECSSIRITSQ